MDLLEKLKKNDRFSRAFAHEMLLTNITEQLLALIPPEDIPKVAQRLECTTSKVRRMLEGRRKMSIRDLSDLLWASGVELEVQFKKLPT